MLQSISTFLKLLVLTPLILGAADVSRSHPYDLSQTAIQPTVYTWTSLPVGGTAELLTLNWKTADQSVPLLAVLRDTLGDESPDNDRLSYVWLLSTGQFSFGQRLLSAVPFFYWKVGNSGVKAERGYPAPLLNLNAPLHPVMNKAGRSIVQWAAFDPLSTAVRASSRSYQANQSDRQRLQLEQAIAYLRAAPRSGAKPCLTQTELHSLLARLQLQKSMLGGLMSKEYIADFGQRTQIQEETVRSRNFEVLRQLAEKTGNYFEPMSLAGSAVRYGILWFPANSAQPATGVSSQPVWKLLNIRDPWSDHALVKWRGLSFQRTFDDGGKLLPFGDDGVRTATLIPLAVYSLDYPQMPLLLVDFRDKLRVGRHEIVQRTITELTAGVLGLSHFGNWYYYAAAFAYQTIWSRRGNASHQSSRLDCYTTFRTQLALDHQLDPKLRDALVQRAGALNVNPLDSNPGTHISNAKVQYTRLENAADGQALLSRLDKARRAELATFGESKQASATRNTLHFLSLGTYTHRAARASSNLVKLDRDRRLAYHLAYLDAATENGTDPLIPFSSAQITASVTEVRMLLGDDATLPVRQHAQATLARVQRLSQGDLRRENLAETVESVTVSK